MIHLTQSGRCGNQMFEYAFARKLQTLCPGEGLTLHFGDILRKAAGSGNGDFWEDSLARFCTVPYQIDPGEGDAVKQHGSPTQKALYWLWRKLNTPVNLSLSPRALAWKEHLFTVFSSFVQRQPIITGCCSAMPKCC